MLEANDLILFAHVIDAGSFSRATLRTGLPKSTLSRRISQLESRLGERLLQRTTRQLMITDFGERVLEHARRLQEELDAANALAAHRQRTPGGVLRVSLPPDFHELNLSGFLLGFSARYPDVRLELDLSARRVDLIAERFDLAVRVAGQLPDDNTLVARQVAHLQPGLYASAAYLQRNGIPLEPEDLLNHVGLCLITSSGERKPWRLQREGRHWEGMPSCPLASNALGLQRDLAVNGMGIVELSSRHAAPLVERGLLIQVLPEWSLPALTIWCVTPGRKLLPARTRGFIEMLQIALQPA